MFIFPDPRNPDELASFNEMPNFFRVFNEGEKWCKTLDCATVADLNELVSSGKVRELIRVNEALHEKRYAKVADMVAQRGAKAVMLAGPSSSGKTTSANRLATSERWIFPDRILFFSDASVFSCSIVNLLSPIPPNKPKVAHKRATFEKIILKNFILL